MDPIICILVQQIQIRVGHVYGGVVCKRQYLMITCFAYIIYINEIK